MNNKFLIYLFCIPTAGPIPFQSTPPQYSLRKGQVSPGHEQRMAHQAAIRPRTFPFNQAGQENPAERGPPEPAKTPGTDPAFIASSPTNRPSYLAIYAGSSHAGSLVVSSDSDKVPMSQASCFSFPIISLTCPHPAPIPLPFPKQDSLSSRLWVSESTCITH